MSTTNPAAFGLEELAAVLALPRPSLEPLPTWLAGVLSTGDVRDLDDLEVLDIASEAVRADEGGPLAAVAALFEGLRVRHAHDRVTLAALAALQHYYRPAPIEVRRG